MMIAERLCLGTRCGLTSFWADWLCHVDLSPPMIQGNAIEFKQPQSHCIQMLMLISYPQCQADASWDGAGGYVSMHTSASSQYADIPWDQSAPVSGAAYQPVCTRVQPHAAPSQQPRALHASARLPAGSRQPWRTVRPEPPTQPCRLAQCDQYGTRMPHSDQQQQRQFIPDDVPNVMGCDPPINMDNVADCLIQLCNPAPGCRGSANLACTGAAWHKSYALASCRILLCHGSWARCVLPPSPAGAALLPTPLPLGLPLPELLL